MAEICPEAQLRLGAGHSSISFEPDEIKGRIALDFAWRTRKGRYAGQILLTRAEVNGYELHWRELNSSVKDFTSVSQDNPTLDIAMRLGVYKENIRLRETYDSLVWSGDGKANFRAGDILEKCQTKGVKEWWWNKIWNNSAPAKSCWHTYVACEGRLPTLDRLKKAGIQLANRWSLCFCAEETNKHVLIKCNTAKDVWRFVAAKFGRMKFPQGEIAAELKRWLQGSNKTQAQNRWLSYIENSLMGCMVIIKDRGSIHEGEMEVLERILRFHKDYGGDYIIVSPIKE
ncbi:hypothetical protein EJ110_NYTH04735 [Nymphaea thermarum]|nr:hypothetical protein EJ110_NYTH04735 [Nymphaea thermarum]